MSCHVALNSISQSINRIDVASQLTKQIYIKLLMNKLNSLAPTGFI